MRYIKVAWAWVRKERTVAEYVELFLASIGLLWVLSAFIPLGG